MANSAEWKPVPLVAGVGQRYRDTSTDGLLTNAYLQKDEAGAVWVRRRGGFQEQPAKSAPDGIQFAGGIMQAISTSNAFPPSLYVGGDGKIYKDGALNYTFGTSGAVWFDQSTVTTINELYASNGSEGAYASAGTFAKITDVNYPAQTVNGSAFLNGYLYVLAQNGAIWGTPNQNDFSVWSATNVINAWGTSGRAVAIRRYLNEVVVFKTNSCEVFYDAGNAIGSPLLPVLQINIKWGCLDARSIQVIDDLVFWAGQSQTGEVAIVAMSQFNPQPISSESINRILTATFPSDGPYSSQNPFISVRGSASFQMGGDKFYLITLQYGIDSSGIANAVTKTFAYNLSNQEWSIFDSLMTTTPVIGGLTNSGLSIVDSTYGNNLVTGNGQVISVADTHGYDQNHVPGNATAIKYGIQSRLRTDNFDGGTSLRKMVSGLRIKADQKSASTLRIRWSDDDYQTWSAWRTIDLSKPVPSLPGLQGTFAKRAYEVEYAGSDPIRYSKLELLIALGDI